MGKYEALVGRWSGNFALWGNTERKALYFLCMNALHMITLTAQPVLSSRISLRASNKLHPQEKHSRPQNQQTLHGRNTISNCARFEHWCRKYAFHGIRLPLHDHDRHRDDNNKRRQCTQEENQGWLSPFHAPTASAAKPSWPTAVED